MAVFSMECDHGKLSKVQGFFMKRYIKRPSLIEDEVMITVTNIHFCDIEGYGTKHSSLKWVTKTQYVDVIGLLAG